MNARKYGKNVDWVFGGEFGSIQRKTYWYYSQMHMTIDLLLIIMEISIKTYYDSAAGLFHYTGEGQKRDQTVSHGNKRLRDAKVDDTRVLFVRQYIPKGKL